MNQLKGVHHVTAITSSAEKIYDFFTSVLGMRLVKKTVNQDDIQTYHLFFADDKLYRYDVREIFFRNTQINHEIVDMITWIAFNYFYDIRLHIDF